MNFTEQDITTMGLPKIDEENPMLHHLIPAQMNLPDLVAIARQLCLYKENELPISECEELYVYIKNWVRGLIARKACAQLDKVDFSNDHLLYLSMSELEHLIHHEIIARQVYSHTHEDDPGKFFDSRRMSRFSTDFLSQQLRSKGFGLFALTDLTPNMESILDLIERHPESIQRAFKNSSSS